MYKNILILGSNKTGKTTLSRKISEKYGYSIINLDNLVDAFDKTITKKGNEINYNMYKTKLIINFIERLSGDSNFLNNKKYVIEGNVSDIETVIKSVDQSKLAVVGLTYDSLSEEDLFNGIRKNDTSYDWTSYINDESLKQNVRFFIDRNKRMSKQFDELEVKKFDVSEDREDTFNKIVVEMESATKIGFNYKVKEM